MPDEARLMPMLSYADAPGAIEFLTKAFGFEERMRMEMPDGKIGHAELDYEGATISLASEYPTMGLQSPRHLDGWHSQIYVRVDDVDAHYERARAAGATIAEAPADQDYGGRLYSCRDPGGKLWNFGSYDPWTD